MLHRAQERQRRCRCRWLITPVVPWSLKYNFHHATCHEFLMFMSKACEFPWIPCSTRWECFFSLNFLILMQNYWTLFFRDWCSNNRKKCFHPFMKLSFSNTTSLTKMFTMDREKKKLLAFKSIGCRCDFLPWWRFLPLWRSFHQTLRRNWPGRHCLGQSSAFQQAIGFRSLNPLNFRSFSSILGMNMFVLSYTTCPQDISRCCLPPHPTAMIARLWWLYDWSHPHWLRVEVST